MCSSPVVRRQWRLCGEQRVREAVGEYGFDLELGVGVPVPQRRCPSPDPSNWDFRYNTFVGPLNISSENPVGSGGMRVIGNVFLSGDPCGLANTTYDYNAFVTGSGCGTHAITNSLATYLGGFTSTGDPGRTVSWRAACCATRAARPATRARTSRAASVTAAPRLTSAPTRVSRLELHHARGVEGEAPPSTPPIPRPTGPTILWYSPTLRVAASCCLCASSTSGYRFSSS